MTLESGQAIFNQVYQNYIRSATKKGVEFELTKDQFYRLTQEPCFYCGDELTNKRIKKNCIGSFNYNGIDRLDPLKGYTIENSVSSCIVCNKMKFHSPHNSFILKIKQIYEWMNLQGTVTYCKNCDEDVILIEKMAGQICYKCRKIIIPREYGAF